MDVVVDVSSGGEDCGADGKTANFLTVDVACNWVGPDIESGDATAGDGSPEGAVDSAVYVGIKGAGAVPGFAGN